jgi:hypothetical protein
MVFLNKDKMMDNAQKHNISNNNSLLFFNYIFSFINEHIFFVNRAVVQGIPVCDHETTFILH